ncbi:hypothetical protein GDO78_013665 [Eleutherodactylus coqui]|uniref:Uncharacterized protein n=1 Tax=Eleutherodactylus coqui TaxID=57060 RepID=A0A8J6BAV2_ELECQ|nr:hypothetical protein GDO78_013665 [Eleutherodactylus coqui]
MGSSQDRSSIVDWQVSVAREHCCLPGQCTHALSLFLQETNCAIPIAVARLGIASQVFIHFNNGFACNTKMGHCSGKRAVCFRHTSAQCTDPENSSLSGVPGSLMICF